MAHSHPVAPASSTLPFWSVVLAGGAGRRLAAVTGATPKQFWRPDGERSLLEDTLARVTALTPPERTVLVVDATHGPFLAETSPRETDHVQYQPRDRGTAVGLFFGLLPILDAGDDAIVLVTPADHGISHAARFRNSVLDAAAAVRAGQPEIVLFGAAPVEPCTDYGWIALGAPAGAGRAARFRQVASFVEKPSLSDAEDLYRDGAVWNTLVMVARARALVSLFERHVPGLAALFLVAAGFAADERARVLSRHYADMAPVDLSRDVLTPARNLAASVWPASMGWTDLGTPERLLRWRSVRAAAGPLSRRSPAHAAS